MYLSGMGTTVAELPNGGKNIRLFLNYPPGSPQTQPPLVGQAGGCRTAAGCFMTGHYDVSLPSGPCSQPDPQEFASFADMLMYANSRGETTFPTTSDADVNALCSSRAPAPASYGPPVIQAAGPTAPSSTTIVIGGKPSSVAQPAIPGPTSFVPTTTAIDTGPVGPGPLDTAPAPALTEMISPGFLSAGLVVAVLFLGSRIGRKS